MFHLRGNQRTSGERSRKEGGKIFDAGSRAPIAITVFVRNPAATEQGVIRFHDIGEYLSRDEKLVTIKSHRSIDGLTRANAWQPITPNEAGDWINQRDERFDTFLPLGDKKSDGETLFETFSMGVKTNRDAWCYNASKGKLESNMGKMIDFYNTEVERFEHSGGTIEPAEFVDKDARRISWNRSLRNDLKKGRRHSLIVADIRRGIYRPYFANHLYFNQSLVNDVALIPRIFPHSSCGNKVIAVTGTGSATAFSSLLMGQIPDLETISKSQCFPLYLFDSVGDEDDLFADEGVEGYKRRDSITDAGLAHFRDAYQGEEISKEDLFYYVYGLLHSPDYRDRYADTLTKQLPRIPRVKSTADFRAFSEAGRRLGDLHVNYESVDPYPVEYDGGALLFDSFNDADFRVEKMKFAGKRGAQDKTTVIYNPKITMTGIPLEAYDYIVNGKPALEWVMERQSVKVDKASGIVNDANDYAIETVGDARYPLILFQRVITVSLETMKIVRALPRLDFNTLS